LGARGAGVGAKADPIPEEHFFKGSGGIGLVGGSGALFPGIPGSGIPDFECQGMAIPIDELVGFGGFWGGIKAAELEFLNLLHIVFKLITIYYRIKWQKIQKNLNQIKEMSNQKLKKAIRRCPASDLRRDYSPGT